MVPVVRQEGHDETRSMHAAIMNGWDFRHLGLSRTTLLIFRRLLAYRNSSAVLTLANLVIEDFFSSQCCTFTFHKLGMEQSTSIAESSEPVRATTPFWGLGSTTPVAFIHGLINHFGDTVHFSAHSGSWSRQKVHRTIQTGQVV